VDGDVRVLVVGKEVLGAMKRIVPEGDFRSNASLGANAEKVEMTSEMEEVALKAANVMGYDVAGVDLMRFDER
jgi:ribosomal protein S6--L-glutamate ligase